MAAVRYRLIGERSRGLAGWPTSRLVSSGTAPSIALRFSAPVRELLALSRRKSSLTLFPSLVMTPITVNLNRRTSANERSVSGADHKE